MGIRIITDTTSDISRKQAEKMDITLVPLKVIFGDKEYREGVDISIDEFYEKLIKAEQLPTTSQPSPDVFLHHFLDGKAAGDSIIVILVSAKLSGTYQSAMIAKEMAGYDDIHIIDSNTTITALRILVEQAVKLKNSGADVRRIVEFIEELKEKVALIAMIDTLEYLHKGGRLSRSSTILGTLLKFKPIITLDDGVIKVIGKERGINRGISRIIEAVTASGGIDTDYPVYFGYTAQDDKCKLLRDKLIKSFDLTNVNMYPVGCVVGTHAGPGGCVVTYIKK